MLLTAKLRFAPDERQTCADIVGMPVSFVNHGSPSGEEKIVGKVVRATPAPDSEYYPHPMMDLVVEFDEGALPAGAVECLRNPSAPGGVGISLENDWHKWRAPARLTGP